MANGTIDSLDIKIGASSEGVVNQLNNIARAMTAIKAASAGNVGRGLQEAIRTINNLSVQKVGALADALGKLKGISINSKLADNLMDFEAAVSLIAEKKGAIENIERITSALGRLQGVNLTGFSSATGKIGNTKGANFFSGMTADQVTAMSKTEMLKAKIDALKASLQEKMDAGVIDDKGIANSAQQIQKLTEQYEKLTQAKKEAKKENEKIYNPSEPGEGVVDNVSEATKKISKLSRFLAAFKTTAKDGIMSKVTAITGGLGGPAGIALAAASTALTGILKLLRKAASLVWNIAKGIAKWAFHTAVEALKKAWSLLQNIAKSISKTVGTVGKGLAAAGKGLASFMWEHTTFSKLTGAFERLKKVLSSFTRVAFYRLIRSAIKFVTDALKEGSNNAYFFSKKFGDATRYISENMDILSTSTFKMRNQVGAAWSTLIATVEPLLLRLLELVTRAAQIVTQFFGAMGGKSSYLRAKSFPKTWAEDAEEAANKTKEWKNQLMDFDTLNRLNENLDSGGGKGSDVTDYGELFEEVPIESWLEDLKDMDPYDIGLTIAGGLNDLTKKIDDWFLGIRPKLKKYAKDFSDLLNGLIDGTDWALLGKTVGDGLNTVFDAIDTFLTNTRWKDLGRGVGTAIKSLFDTVDWDLIGSTFAHGWNALLHFIEGLVTTPGIWESMGRSIGEFVHAWFREIDINSLATSIIAIINGVATAVENFLAQNPFANIAEKLTNAIQRIIAGVKWGYVGEQFGKLFQEVLNQINTVIFGTNWVAFGASLGTMLNNFIAKIDFNMLGQTLVGVFTSALNILYGVLITPGFATNLAKSLSNFMLGALTQFADWLESLEPAIIAGAIRNFFGNIKYEEITNAFVRVVRAAWTLAMSVKENLFPDGLLPTVAGYISSWFASVDWVSVGHTISAKIREAWTWAMDTLDKIWPKESREAFLSEAVSKIVDIGWEIGRRFATAIGEKFGEWWHGTTLGKIFDWITMSVDPTGTAWKLIYNYAAEDGKGIVGNIEHGIMEKSHDYNNAIKGYVVDPLSEWLYQMEQSSETAGKNVGTAAGKGLREGYGKQWSEFATSATGAIGTVSEGMARAVKTGFSGVSESINASVGKSKSALQEFAGSASSSIQGIIDSAKSAIDRLRNSVQAGLSKYTSGSTKKFASGGFPEDGVFFANHGELVGKFSNGKTAVANNEQIISGIEQGTEQGVYRAMSMAMGANRGDDGGVINVYVGDELVYSGYSKWNKRQQLMAGGRA